MVANEVPSLFRSWERFLTFCLLTLLLSPFLTSTAMARFRVMTFWYLQWSHACGDWGVGHPLSVRLSGLRPCLLFRSDQPLDADGSRRRLLGAIRAPPGVEQREYRSSPVVRVLLWCLLAASWRWCSPPPRGRRSPRSCSVSSLACSYFRKRLARFVFYGLVAGLRASLLLFQWGEVLTEGISRKGPPDRPSGPSTRRDHWDQRITEFLGSPYVGIGFGAVDLSADGGSIYSDDGRVETGSSWLAIASMLGVLGCLHSCRSSAARFGRLRRIATRGDEVVVGYLASLLVFWAAHMLAEGYILAAGSFLFANVWLLLGVVGALDGYPELESASGLIEGMLGYSRARADPVCPRIALAWGVSGIAVAFRVASDVPLAKNLSNVNGILVDERRPAHLPIPTAAPGVCAPTAAPGCRTSAIRECLLSIAKSRRAVSRWRLAESVTSRSERVSAITSSVRSE